MNERRPTMAVVRREDADAAVAPAQGVFGELIRRFRMAAGLTQEELAERAGISARSVSDFERGLTHRPQRETLRLLSDALQLAGDDRLLFETVARGRAVPTPHLVTRGTPPHNLPTPLTPLVGRDTERAALVTLLRRDAVRLVTVTGTGGIGKTRLALAAAKDVLDAFPDGVFLVSLAAVRDPDFVLAAIAETLGVKTHARQKVWEELVRHLARKRLLLVLDNFEQIIPAAVSVADLLLACGDVKAMVTSRAALHVRGEHEWPVFPLALPKPGDTADPRALARVAAVDLFLQRAEAVRPGFQLTDANARAIAALCARLDGLPLAIELTAAQIKVATPVHLLNRLERHVPPLTPGARDLPERQRTMHATIAWSYDLLSPDEQRLFRARGVFAGGWTIEAAEAVASAIGGPSGDAADPILTALLDHSLVRQEVSGEDLRYTMLETIREYAAERAVAEGEYETACRAHARYFLALAEEAAPHLTGPEQAAWLGRLETEHANIRAALGWLRGAEDGEAGLRFATALAQFWLVRGYASEGLEWLEAFGALMPEGNDGAPERLALRAQALNAIGTLANRQGDYQRASTAYDASLSLWRTLRDGGKIALVLRNLGVVAWYRGDHDRAAASFRESLARYRELDDLSGIAGACNNLGLVADRRGHYDEAVERYTAALTLWRKLGEKQGIANALHNLGLVAQKRLDTDAAQCYYSESLAIRREIGDKPGIAQSLNGLGIIASLRCEYDRADTLFAESLALDRELGNRASAAHALYHWAVALQRSGAYERARASYEESLTIREAIGSQVEIADSLTGLAHIARVTGDDDRSETLYKAALPRYRTTGNALGAVGCLEGIALLADRRGQQDHAVTLLAATHALRDALGTPQMQTERAIVSRALAAIRAGLGETAFTVAWEAGAAMSMDAACDAALAGTPASSSRAQ